MIVSFNTKTNMHLECLVNLCNTSSLAKLFEYQLSFIKPGNAIINQPYKDCLTQSCGFVHGGVIATIADTVGGFAANSLSKEYYFATGEFKINFLERSEPKTLKSFGTVIKKGAKIMVCELKVFCDDKLVAIGIGSYIITSLKFSEIENYKRTD